MRGMFVTLSVLAGLALSSCNGSDSKTKENGKPDGPKMPTGKELAAQQIELLEVMDSNDTVNNKLQDAVTEKKEQAEIDRWLRAMRHNMGRAKALWYMDTEAKEKELDKEFDIFLGSLDKVSNKTWGDSGMAHWRMIQKACSRCHCKFTEDE